jgi:hypothetical protein
LITITGIEPHLLKIGQPVAKQLVKKWSAERKARGRRGPDLTDLVDNQVRRRYPAAVAVAGRTTHHSEPKSTLCVAYLSPSVAGRMSRRGPRAVEFVLSVWAVDRARARHAHLGPTLRRVT